MCQSFTLQSLESSSGGTLSARRQKPSGAGAVPTETRAGGHITRLFGLVKDSRTSDRVHGSCWSWIISQTSKRETVQSSSNDFEEPA